MKTNEKHNGWTNYETWLVNLFIDGNYTSEQEYKYWRDQATECLKEAKEQHERDGAHLFTDEENATRALAEQLKDQIETAMTTHPWVAGCVSRERAMQGLQADMMRAALGEVNWREIAAALIEGVQE